MAYQAVQVNKSLWWRKRASGSIQHATPQKCYYIPSINMREYNNKQTIGKAQA